MNRRTMLAAMSGLLPSIRADEPKPSGLNGIGAIDAHVHFYSFQPPLQELMSRSNLRFVTVCVLDPYGPGGYETKDLQQQATAEIARSSQGRATWVCTFDPRGFEDSQFAERVIADLDKSFAQGAVGVKIYKTIGMDLRRKDGSYLMPNDPVFSPVFEAIAARGKTLYAHIAEPLTAWRPFDSSDPLARYYKDNPAWHISSHPDRPSKEAIIAARDRMLARHPKLRVVGCHLGSLEEDVTELAHRLDRYPNLAVDTAARIPNLAMQPADKVRDFILKYQDRILYATDYSILPGNDDAAKAQAWERYLDHDWQYLAGKLSLPSPVLEKIFRTNTIKWTQGF